MDLGIQLSITAASLNAQIHPYLRFHSFPNNRGNMLYNDVSQLQTGANVKDLWAWKSHSLLDP